MQLIIDRFEGKYAILEYKSQTFNFPLDLLPPGVKEGDIIKLNIEIDTAATIKEKAALQNELNSLFKEES